MKKREKNRDSNDNNQSYILESDEKYDLANLSENENSNQLNNVNDVKTDSGCWRTKIGIAVRVISYYSNLHA